MAWVARNNGLVGSALNVNYIIIFPGTKNLASENHELFIATDGGVFQSTDGGRAWAQLTLPDPSNAEFGDSPAATVDELTFHWVEFDPLQLNTIYVLAAKDSVSRLWLYKSVNIGNTWTSRGVMTS
jgi:hypothetical protein